MCHRGAKLHATSVSGARVGRMGPRMTQLTQFRDPDARFESLGTQAKSRDKFGDLDCCA